jgi:hypothetical protein
MDDAFAQEVEAGAAVHLSVECLDPVDIALGGAGAVGQGEPGGDAAFMLLETKNIVQFALLFGATWFVNSLVSAGVLVAVYLAVETARHVRLPRPMVLYAALAMSLAVTWLVPPDAPLGLPLIPRFLAASALAFAPIYIANLIFAQRFSGVEMIGTALAADLLGAMVGGVIEYTRASPATGSCSSWPAPCTPWPSYPAGSCAAPRRRHHCRQHR